MNNLRSFFTQLNLHAAGVLLLLVIDLSLATKLILAWHDAGSDQSSEYTADLVKYGHLQAQLQHLQSLPTKVESSRKEAAAFSSGRIPVDQSTIVAELGALSNRNHVRLSGAQYTPAQSVPGLIEWRVDTRMSGEYIPIMHFINDVERDRNHVFFIIRNVTLTGQQGGLVNLRLRMTTYMHADPASSQVYAIEGRASSETQ